MVTSSSFPFRTELSGRPRNRAPSLAVLVLAAAGARCGDAVAPEELLGDYPLAAVNDMPFPATIGEAEGCELSVVDGALQFRRSSPPSGSHDWSTVGFVQVRDCRAIGGDSTALPVLYLGTFVLRGPSLTFVTEPSDVDTLRFAGSSAAGFIDLSLGDSLRGGVLVAPVSLRFGPRQSATGVLALASRSPPS